MAYELTQQDLIEDCQRYLDADPRFFLEDEGCFTWAGKVVMFYKAGEDITLDYDGQSITFPRYA